MRKTIFLLFIIALCFIEGHSCFSQQHKGKNSHTPTTSTPNIPRQNTHGEHLSADTQHKPEKDPISSIRLIVAPKDFYDKAAVWLSVILAIVGIGGSIVAVVTLNKISRQTDAIERSTRLQEITLKQWVTVEHWRNTSSLAPIQPEKRNLRLGLSICNPTKLPLTLKKLMVSIGNYTTETQTPDYLIAPDKDFETTVCIWLEPSHFGPYDGGILVLKAVVDVEFADALKAAQPQHISHLLVLGPDKCNSAEYESE